MKKKELKKLDNIYEEMREVAKKMGLSISDKYFIVNDSAYVELSDYRSPILMAERDIWDGSWVGVCYFCKHAELSESTFPCEDCTYPDFIYYEEYERA